MKLSRGGNARKLGLQSTPELTPSLTNGVKLIKLSSSSFLVSKKFRKLNAHIRYLISIVPGSWKALKK